MGNSKEAVSVCVCAGGRGRVTSPTGTSGPPCSWAPGHLSSPVPVLEILGSKGILVQWGQDQGPACALRVIFCLPAHVWGIAVSSLGCVREGEGSQDMCWTLAHSLRFLGK